MTHAIVARERSDCLEETRRPFRRGRVYAVAVTTAIILASAAPAHAGGQMVDLAVGGNRVWLVGDPVGVQVLSASTGDTIASPTLVGAASPLTVALVGGAGWVGSVEGGYIWGTLSRIDMRTGKVRVVWRKQQSSVQYVAAGAGSVWALIGFNSTSGSRVAMQVTRFSLNGLLLRTWKLPRDAGRMAADGSGCWISTNHSLLHIDPTGRLYRALRAPFGDIATGGGAVWLAENDKVLRIDERTGKTQTIATGTLRLGGFQHDLAATSSALYLLNSGASVSRLVQIDLHSRSVARSAPLRGIGDAVILAPHAIWVATSTANVYRLDPRTLHRTLFVSVP